MMGKTAYDFWVWSILCMLWGVTWLVASNSFSFWILQVLWLKKEEPNFMQLMKGNVLFKGVCLQ